MARRVTFSGQILGMEPLTCGQCHFTDDVSEIIQNQYVENALKISTEK